MERLYSWRNEPEVLCYTPSGKEVTRLEHERWFQLQCKKKQLMVIEALIENQKTLVGQLRYEPQQVAGEKYFKLSVIIAAELRGKGLGKRVIEEGLREIMKKRDDGGQERIRFWACVHRGNIASMALFQATQFEESFDRSIWQSLLPSLSHQSWALFQRKLK